MTRMILLALAWLCLTHVAMAEPLHYPAARKGTQVDVYHGTRVADPYRWMEDIDSPEVKAWIEQEQRLTDAWFQQVPQREAIRKRLSALWNYEKHGVPWKEGGHYFFRKNNGLQNQSVLYVQDDLQQKPRVLLDPNTLSKDGTVALSGLAVSPDGRYLAYGLAEAGSDWNHWHVRDIATGKDLPDRLDWVKFSGATWLPDGSGFFYARYDAPKGGKLKSVNYFQKLYFHKVGQPQEKDTLVYARPDQKEWGFSASVSEEGDVLIITVWRGTEDKNLLYWKDLKQADAPVKPLVDEWTSSFEWLGNAGHTHFFLTNDQAPRRRVIGIDLQQPERKHWKEPVPQSEEVLDAVSYLNHGFVTVSMKDAHHRVRIIDSQGRSREVQLPGLGSVGGFTGHGDDTETFYRYTSFNTPGGIYRLNLETGESSLFRSPKLAFNPDDYTVKQVFYHSKDGTRVPMFIAHKKGLKINGNTPTLLYGYGGFNISLTPFFSVTNLAWMEMGGIYAMPNLRGGGEYGQAWHEAGTKTRKQNVFDDFIAAAEWLIANGYTQPKKLAIHGGSNGGLLAAAVMLQRPDLMAASIPAVGVLDMLRFNQFTIGWAWESDYGSPKNPEEFRALLAYSPLHNIQPGKAYPATLILTADHDDRVFPAHSFKFAAALQAAQAGDAPILIRIESRAGHGAGKPTSKRIAEATDKLAFLSKILQL